jgi:hypothetical protein
MSVHPVVAELIAIKDRFRLPESALAGFCRVSPSTVERMLLLGKLPRMSGAREAVIRFVEANRHAKHISQIRMVDEVQP